MHSSGCWELNPHTRRGSVVGSDAWSSVSSGEEEVGENTQEASQKRDSSVCSFMTEDKTALCLSSCMLFFPLSKVKACRSHINDID